MTDKPKSKWYWRLLRWGFIGLAVLVTLAAVLVTEENWRGKHDWEAYKHEVEARGERLDLASVIPPAVPDDQNFFCAPIVAEALLADRHSDGGTQTNINPLVDRMNFNLWRGNIANQINQGGSWQKAELTDLKQWQTAFRDFSTTPEGKTNGFPVAAQPQTPAADVLLALSVFNPALEELRRASLRPYARIPLNYDNDFEAAGELLPWLASTKRCVQFLELRILAELQNNQGEEALADVKLLLRVIDCIREQPFLISHLVRNATMAYVVQAIYEGLAQHSWSDAQLMELEQLLATEDFLADYQFTMNSEKIFAIDTFEKQRITREMKFVDDSSGTNKTVTTSLRLMPSAYFYQNELAFARMHQEFIQPLVDSTNRIIAPAALHQAELELKSKMKHYSPYQVQAQMLFPPIVKSVEKFAVQQAGIDLTRVVCALERYRLAHGEYPASLDVLAPQFIDKVPHDIINGQPLHYRVTGTPSSQSSDAASGKFVLYSVGWNEKDDGGTVALTKEGNVDRDNGDWVWKYPAK
jgi:hypothetical protein